jgi:hypothetical protein
MWLRCGGNEDCRVVVAKIDRIGELVSQIRAV